MSSLEDNIAKELHLARLKDVEAFTVNKIITKHIIRYRGEDVEGEPTQADAIVISEGDRLKIYMIDSYFESDKTLDELVTSLGVALQIDELKHGLCLQMLQYVLILDDQSKISKLLDKNRIPRNVDADDDDFEQIEPAKGWSGGGGIAAPNILFRIISSANFHQFAHLFSVSERNGCWVVTTDEGFDASGMGKELSEFGFRVIMPSVGPQGGGYWDPYEGDPEDARLQFLGELEVSLSETFDSTQKEVLIFYCTTGFKPARENSS